MTAPRCLAGSLTQTQRDIYEAVEQWRGHAWTAPGCPHRVLKIIRVDQGLSIVVCLICAASKEVSHVHCMHGVRRMGPQSRP